VGALAALEAQGYLGDPSARQTSLLDGWSVEKAKRLGALAPQLCTMPQRRRDLRCGWDYKVRDAQDTMRLGTGQR